MKKFDWSSRRKYTTCLVVAVGCGLILPCCDHISAHGLNSYKLNSPKAKGRSIPAAAAAPIAILDLKFLEGGDPFFQGIDASGRCVIVIIKDLTYSKGSIKQWDIRDRKFVAALPLTSLLDPGGMQLSADGQLLVTNENPTDPSVPDVQSRHMTIVQMAGLNVKKTIDLGPKVNISAVCQLPGDADHVMLELGFEVPYENDFMYTNNRLAWFNTATGRIDKSVPYSHATGMDSCLLSPGKRFLVCVFGGDKDSKSSVIDVLDAQKGKILWHIESSVQRHIDRTILFTSLTTFASAGLLYDITKKTSRPWKAVSNSIKLVDGVPRNNDFAMFSTPSGLELRNWKKGTVLRRWGSLTKADGVTFSPNLRVFACQMGSVVSFWRFDPSWLK